MLLSGRIAADPHLLAGKPVIRGTRLAVELILELLAAGQLEADLMEKSPVLEREDISGCLSYASYLAHQFRARPVPAQMRLPADENFPKPIL